jgi:hypothetical protein
VVAVVAMVQPQIVMAVQGVLELLYFRTQAQKQLLSVQA